MSSSTYSFINTSRRPKLSMSRYDKSHSVGASEFGRLSLENDSDDEMVETRSQKKGESSRSKDKGKGKVKAGPSSKSQGDRRKSRKTTSTAGRKRPSDDDDDDDDDSSDDEDEVPEPTRRDYFRMMVSVLNLELLSPVEFADSTSMSLQSKTLRVYADNMADHLSQSGREAVWAQNPPSSAAWGEMAFKIMERRKSSAETMFIYGNIDSIEALKRFDLIYFSVHEMLVRPLYRGTHVNAKRDFVYLLADILNFIIREWQQRGGEGTIAYAGSVQAQEHNIYMRFITRPEVHRRYMNTLMGLSQRADLRDMFRTTRVRESLVDSCERIHRYIDGTPPATPVFGPLGNFSQILDHFLQRLSITLPR